MSVGAEGWPALGLWVAVLLSGLYHGINPGMGWPLAVAAGLMDRSARSLFAALAYLGAGHLAAMLLAILPFALLATLLDWQHEIEIAASLLLIVFGGTLLFQRRHARALSRIPPARLALWSLTAAMAHGAGLMLVPIYFGLCRTAASSPGKLAAEALITANLGMALAVSAAHTLAMLLAGGVMAWLVYRYLGLSLISRTWFNLERIWASSLILVGALAFGFAGMH